MINNYNRNKIFFYSSLSTTLCLEWEPEVIAIALIHVSAKFNKFNIDDWKGKKPSHNKWCDLFIKDLDNAVLEDIGNQILDLYSPEKKNPREPGKLPLSLTSPETPSSSTSSPNESLSMTIEGMLKRIIEKIKKNQMKVKKLNKKKIKQN